MRRSTLMHWTAAAALTLGLLPVPTVMASSDDERPGEIGVLAGIGLADEDLVGSDNNTHINPLLGARFAWHFTPAIAGFFDGTWVEYQGDSSLFGDLSEYAFRIGPEWYLNPESRWLRIARTNAVSAERRRSRSVSLSVRAAARQRSSS